LLLDQKVVAPAQGAVQQPFQFPNQPDHEGLTIPFKVVFQYICTKIYVESQSGYMFLF
jgi:hypothetical protein